MLWEIFVLYGYTKQKLFVISHTAFSYVDGPISKCR